MDALRRNIVLMVLMVAATLIALTLHPTHRLADYGAKVDLEAMIPKKFGDWVVNENVVFQQVSPDVKSALDKVYTQVLTRNYVNSQGYRVMVSIPYGVNQSDALSVHDPEGCYPAQGFQIMSKSRGILHTSVGDIPVRWMQAVSGARQEQVTYWFTVGNVAVNNDWERKKAQLSYTLKGVIPDGILFRVSSVDADVKQAYHLQEDFIEALVNALPPDSRERFSGL